MNTGKLIKIFMVLMVIAAIAAIIVGILAISKEDKSEGEKQETVMTDKQDTTPQLPLEDEALLPPTPVAEETLKQAEPVDDTPVLPEQPTVEPTADPTPILTPVPDDSYKDTLVFDGTQEHFITWNIQYQVNVRAEASKDSEKIGELVKDSYGIVLEKGAEFTKIQSKDITGYVANQYLMTGKAADEMILGTSARKVTITKAVNIRDNADMNSNVLGMASEGMTFNYDPSVPEVHGWVGIVYGDYEVAYVSAAFCSVSDT